MQQPSIQYISDQCLAMVDNVDNPIIKKIYSKFAFIYINCCLFQQNNDIIKNLILENLRIYKFITYCYYSDLHKYINFSQKTPNICNDCSTENVDVVLCAESACYIIEQINRNIIDEILQEIESSLINVDEKDSDAYNETSEFCQNFPKQNKFIEYTISPMICFLIRRFYFPSDIFFDKSFFDFYKIYNNENSNLFHEKIHSNLIDLFDFYSEEKSIEKIIETSKTYTNDNNNIEPKIINFRESEFIELRPIYMKKGIKISLNIHIESFYIFAIKKFSNPNENSKEKDHEINFVKKYSHRCINKFYGFVKNDKNETVGLVYEFNSNGSLINFFNENEKINDIFLFTTMTRIYEGIKYLQTNGLIHRDLKPDNILINHDNVAFISDFETVRSVEKESPDLNFTFSIGSQYYMSPEQYFGDYISYPTDIYSFGCIIYFLFEKKEPLDISIKYKSENITQITNVTANIQHLYSSCIKNEQNERITLEEIESILKDEIKSFCYIEKYLIYDFVSITNELISYFCENILFLLKNEDDLTFYFQNILTLELVSLFKYLKYNDNTNRLVSIGNFYYHRSRNKADYSKAKKYYELAANMNNSKAQYFLGLFYYHGYGVEQDYTKAKYYFEKSAENNDDKALYFLGELYFYGYGVMQDYKNARQYYEESAKQNNDDSIFSLGFIYFYGYGVEKDYQIAHKYFERLAKNEDSEALYYLGRIYAIEGNFSKAIEKFESSSKQYNSKAQCSLGIFYYYGYGVNIDYITAKQYFELSSNSKALFYLGEIEYNGYLGEKNYSKARQYYEESVEENYSDAFFSLGELYLNEDNVEHDYKKAIEYFEKSAERNNFKAIIYLGFFYLHGIHVKQDYIKAREYFQKSPVQNNPIAHYYLGDIYFNGYGVKQDYAKAIEYLEKSSEQNYSNSYQYLGLLYFNGCGVKQDYKKAIEYFEKAAELNNSDALCSLGYVYWNGIYVKQDDKRAIDYFVKSVNNENSNALLCLGQAYLFGDGVEQNYDKAIHYFKSSADQDNVFAFINLAFFYLIGLGVDRNISIATELLKKFFENVNNISINYSQVLNVIYHIDNEIIISKFKKICRTFYRQKTFIPNEVSKIFSFLDTIFHNHISDSSNFFNNILETLHICFNFSKVNLTKLLHKSSIFFEITSEEENPASLNILGLKYYYGDKKDYTKAKKYFLLASKKNDSYGFLNLGYFYIDGFGDAIDYINAENNFRLSAKLGNSIAYYELGKLYEEGKGFKIRDKKINQYKKAIKYYEKSAKLNNTDALINLGKLYFKGLGVEQNYDQAIKYYKSASKQNNPKALIKMGKLYSKGLIVEQNIIEAKRCFELAAFQNYPDSFFFLADFYSTGEFFEVNLQYAIQNFQKCIEIEKDFQLIYNTNDESVLRKCCNNKYKYRSYNDLGLIYLILYNNIEEAKTKLERAANGEYPFGQNNFGLFSQFYLNDINEAKYRFEKASKNHFALAEYNMGFLLEEEGKIEDAINCYCRASDYVNHPLKLQNHWHYDKRLEISKTFIICFTNLKLVEYYLSKSDFEKSKRYLIKSFEKIITYDDNSFYRFNFIFHNNKDMKEDFSYLRSFIFNYPPFNFINPKNIDLKSQLNLNTCQSLQVKQNNQDSKKDFSSFVLFKKLFYCIYNKVCFWKSETIKNPNSFELNNNNFSNENQNMINLISEINENNYFLGYINENRNCIIALNDDLVIKELAELFDMILKNEKMKIVFIDEIRYIINIMKEILYKPPYHILFGRIFIDKIKPKKKQIEKQNINHLFYEGFGNI